MSSFLTSFIYSSERRWRISRHMSFWIAYVIFATILYGSKGLGATQNSAEQLQILGLAFVEAIFFLPIHILFSYGLIYLLIPRFLFKGEYVQLFLGTFILMLLVAVLSSVIGNTLVASFRHYLGFASPPSYFYFGLMAGLRGGTTVAGFAAAIKLSKYWYQKHWANQALEKQKLQAELQLLKSQIHPHFLFNTLNNLYSLTLTQSEKAPDVVLKLSDLLSYMLYECNQPTVSLDKEIKLMHGYIDLEKLRYGQRLDVQMKVSGVPVKQQIAPLLFLPFLENAFKFGVNEMLDQAWIHLDLKIQKDSIQFKLVNSRASPAGKNTSQGGIGLQNVRKRLELLYPAQHELVITEEEDLFIVNLKIQLRGQEVLTSSFTTNPLNATRHEDPMHVGG